MPEFRGSKISGIQPGQSIGSDAAAVRAPLLRGTVQDACGLLQARRESMPPRILRTAKGDRLEAEEVLTAEDFERLAVKLGRAPLRARKTGFVAARKAATPETVETRWNGKETTNTAQPGDWIVTNLSPARVPLRDADGHTNVYVIVADRFLALYEPTGKAGPHGPVYRARGTISALPFPGGFDILAPWGRRQATASGYLICNGPEVYGSSKEAFEETYGETC
jgi:hypothetical protein